MVYGEWHIYPDKRERRHDVLWRGEQTTEEVTLEDSVTLGQKKRGKWTLFIDTFQFVLTSLCLSVC